MMTMGLLMKLLVLIKPSLLMVPKFSKGLVANKKSLPPLLMMLLLINSPLTVNSPLRVRNSPVKSSTMGRPNRSKTKSQQVVVMVPLLVIVTSELMTKATPKQSSKQNGGVAMVNVSPEFTVKSVFITQRSDENPGSRKVSGTHSPPKASQEVWSEMVPPTANAS